MNNSIQAICGHYCTSGQAICGCHVHFNTRFLKSSLDWRNDGVCVMWDEVVPSLVASRCTIVVIPSDCGVAIERPPECSSAKGVEVKFPTSMNGDASNGEMKAPRAKLKWRACRKGGERLPHRRRQNTFAPVIITITIIMQFQVLHGEVSINIWLR